MDQPAIIALFAIFVWWLSTGVILALCTRSPRFQIWGLSAATLVLVGSLWMLEVASDDTEVFGAYAAFLASIGVWGWIEMTFLTGLVTGPRKSPCPEGTTGWPRFRMAVESLLYHELTIVVAGAVVLAITWGAPNQTGALAFAILMAMRLSAKLNLFLGVPNLTDELMPPRLAHLKSYFRKSDVNPLFPVAVIAAGGVAGLLALAAFGAEADSADKVGFGLLFILIALGILEHVFMVVRLPDAALWRWAIPASPRDVGRPPDP